MTTKPEQPDFRSWSNAQLAEAIESWNAAGFPPLINAGQALLARAEQARRIAEITHPVSQTAVLQAVQIGVDVTDKGRTICLIVSIADGVPLPAPDEQEAWIREMVRRAFRFPTGGGGPTKPAPDRSAQISSVFDEREKRILRAVEARLQERDANRWRSCS